jgi:hypothetical protein
MYVYDKLEAVWAYSVSRTSRKGINLDADCDGLFVEINLPVIQNAVNAMVCLTHACGLDTVYPNRGSWKKEGSRFRLQEAGLFIF